ncbi:MAG: glycolate oxidase subunit GlcF [Gammaproteobacteria bacterium]|nr:glycolate oxidase subunit GlcF [Gammaproteobacteria bacterium]
MQTNIHSALIDLPMVKEANSILRTCVHCGFCTATCPTYQLLGDELDGPRGRIYLIKNLLEDDAIDERSVQHLDRCLTCRACETTCPSGVQYGRLLDIGRELIVTRSKRPMLDRLLSFLLRLVIPRGYLFRPLLKLGQFLSPVMPQVVARKIPPKQKYLRLVARELESPRMRVLLLQGCVQSAATPNVIRVIEQLLNDKGVATLTMPDEGCCGALDYHLSAHNEGRRRMRDLVDKLFERLSEIDYIVSSASGCGVTIKEYPIYLSEDPEYADKSRQIIDKVVDVSELLGKFEFSCTSVHVAVHTPCTLQHGQSIDGEIERILENSGITISKSRESHLCCGSAGTYSILQPDLSTQLLKGKLSALQENSPDVIVTANIGCQLHLQSGANVPVMHWVELLHQQLVRGSLAQPLDENDISFT